MTVITMTFILLPAWDIIARDVRPSLGKLKLQSTGVLSGGTPHKPGTTGKDCVVSASLPIIHLAGTTDGCSVHNMCKLAMMVCKCRSVDEFAKPAAGF